MSTLGRAIGATLKDLRSQRFASQRGIADLSGIGVKKYGSFEHSPERAEALRVRDLLELLQVYEIEPAEFFRRVKQHQGGPR